MKNEQVSFKEYLLDFLKYLIEGYKQIFEDSKKKIVEIPEVVGFIIKILWKNKKTVIYILGFQFPIVLVYFSFNYLKDNIVLLILSIIFAILLSSILQIYYWYLLNDRRRMAILE